MSSIAVDLTDDVKSRSASSAAAKLEHLSGDTMVHEPAAQPGSRAGRARRAAQRGAQRVAAAPADVARQWQRNGLYDPDHRPADGAGGRFVPARSPRSARCRGAARARDARAHHVRLRRGPPRAPSRPRHRARSPVQPARAARPGDAARRVRAARRDAAPGRCCSCSGGTIRSTR